MIPVQKCVAFSCHVSLGLHHSQTVPQSFLDFNDLDSLNI